MLVGARFGRCEIWPVRDSGIESDLGGYDRNQVLGRHVQMDVLEEGEGVGHVRVGPS